MYAKSIKRERYHYKNRPVILDASELSPGKIEVMLMRTNGTELASGTASTEAEALELFQKIRAAHLPDNERPAPAPVVLTGKYAQLRDDLRKAYSIGKEAAAFVDDLGTCNLDAPSLSLPRWREALVKQAAEEAGCGCFTWGYFKRFVFCPRIPGQARKREVAAEAMTKALASMGYDALTYCQMD